MAHKRDNRRKGKRETLRRKQVRAVKYAAVDLDESCLTVQPYVWS